MAYRLDYDERIVSVETGVTTPEGRDIVRSVNAAESTIFGIEAGLQAALTDRFEIDANLNYTRGTQRVGQIEEPGDRIPPLQLRLNLSYRPSPAWRIDASLLAADGQDRLSARDVGDARIDPDGTPGWAVVGAGALWTHPDGWQVALAVDNIFDRRYRVHGSGLDAPGINLGLTVRRTW